MIWEKPNEARADLEAPEISNFAFRLSDVEREHLLDLTLEELLLDCTYRPIFDDVVTPSMYFWKNRVPLWTLINSVVNYDTTFYNAKLVDWLCNLMYINDNFALLRVFSTLENIAPFEPDFIKSLIEYSFQKSAFGKYCKIVYYRIDHMFDNETITVDYDKKKKQLTPVIDRTYEPFDDWLARIQVDRVSKPKLKFPPKPSRKTLFDL